MPLRFRRDKKKEDAAAAAAAAASAAEPPRSPSLQRKDTKRPDKKGRRNTASSVSDRTLSTSAGDIPTTVNNGQAGGFGGGLAGSSGTVTPSPEPSDSSAVHSPQSHSTLGAASHKADPRRSDSQRSADSRKSSVPSMGSFGTGDQSSRPRPQRAVTVTARSSGAASFAPERQRTGSSSQRSRPAVKKSARDEFLESVSTAEKQLSGLPLSLPSFAASSVDGTVRTVTLKREPKGFGFTLRQQPGNPHPMHVVEANGLNSQASAVLLANDRLLEVNGVSVEGANHSRVVDLIKESGDELRLTLMSITELMELGDEGGGVGDGGEVLSELTGHTASNGSPGGAPPSLHSQLSSGGVSSSKMGGYHGETLRKGVKARTEEELTREREWQAVEKVWLVHKDGFTQATLLRKTISERPKHNFTSVGAEPCYIKLENGDIVAVDETDVERANPTNFDRVEDLATLRQLNMSSVLHTLRQRYGSGLVHTLAGPHLVVVNPMKSMNLYTDKIIQRFRSDRTLVNKPHIFAVAEKAYQRLRTTHQDQSIIPMGISGSGKSVSIGHVLRYFSMLPKTKGCMLTPDRMAGIQTLLKMFTSCASVIHENATRFTSLTGIEFDATGQLVGGSIQVYLLEKSRAARRSDLEYNFHIFYQLFCGADEQLKQELQLTNLEEENAFFRNLPKEGGREHRHFSGQWEATVKAFSAVGISSEQVKGVWSLLAAIFHLGAANAVRMQTQGQRTVTGRFANPAAAQRAASLLGTTLEELQRSVFATSASTGTGGKRPNSAISSSSSSFADIPSPMTSAVNSPAIPSVTSSSPAMPGSSTMEALENFAMGIYDAMFFALLQIINRSIFPTQRSANTIQVMDMPGLQNPVAGAQQEVGLQFEDLCINYAQERLQMLFYDHVFTLEQERYSQENVDCKFMTYVPNPLSIISLCDRMVSSQAMPRMDVSVTERKGLFWIVDDEAQRPNNSEKNLLEQLDQIHGKGEQREKPSLRVLPDTSSFILVHCQGVMPVEYDVRGWLRRAREHASFKAANSMIQDVQSGCISALIRGRLATSESQSSSSNSLASMTSDHSYKRTMRRPVLGGGKRVSLCMQTKFHQDLIMDTLRKTSPQFVLCVLPLPHALPDWQKHPVMASSGNSTATSSTSLHIGQTGSVGVIRGTTHVGQLMDVPLVRLQLRRTELVNAMRLYRQGFPDYMPFGEFLRKFQPLANVQSMLTETGSVDEKKAVEELLFKLEIDKKAYRLGLSQVFLRAGTLVKLEGARDERSFDTIVLFQAQCRGMLARRRLEKMRTHLVAVQCLQRNIRKFIVFRNWPWWKLYTKVKPVLDIHRTDEELREKKQLIDSLQAKIDKLQRDYSGIRENESQLKERVSQLTGDLQEERAALRSTDETLEQEQMERLRLEQELAEIQAEHTLVKNQKDQLSLQLTEAQLLSATSDTVAMSFTPDEDLEDDSLSRGQYERLKADHKQALERLRVEMEQENEKLRSAKRRADQQVSAAQMEAEDLQASLANSKKKTNRLESELDDLQLHLEDEQERNAELERKQRRFDAELSGAQEEVERERDMREKMSRSTEVEQAGKLTLKKQLDEADDTRLDLEKQIKRLREELEDASSMGNKDERELASLRKQKRDQDRKIEDQEEELEDLAGQVHQLEQTRTRLEMANEKLRQQQQKDSEAREEELEGQRFTSHRKIKSLEVQLEEEYEERQNAVRAQRDAEHQMQAMRERLQRGNPEAERKLRKGLARTRALLNDAQAQIQQQQARPEKVKQMKNQLDEAQEDLQSLRRTKTRLERDLEDSQESMEVVERQKLELEQRLSSSQKEREEIESRLEEEQDELDRLMSKQRHTLEKVTSLQIELEESQNLASTLSDDRERYKRQVRDLEQQISDMQSDTVDKLAVQRAEAKMRELEEKLEMESNSKHRMESTVTRLRDNLEQASASTTTSAMESARSRKEADMKENLLELENREADAASKCRRAERALTDMESERDDALTEVKQCKERIKSLQKALNDAAGSDDQGGDMMSDEDDESDLSLDDDDESPRLTASHRSYSRGSRGSGFHSSGGGGSTHRLSRYHDDSDDDDDLDDRPPRSYGKRSSRRASTSDNEDDDDVVETSTSKPWRRHFVDSDDEKDELDSRAARAAAGGGGTASSSRRPRQTTSDDETSGSRRTRRADVYTEEYDA
ncbi:unconventional myosin-XVIIIa-like [Sycon ciliatum]|uniref:unconventional myosin-XVIIIa-like n=1 Tax=Sycon ciliatum TaxID=27933 RepID=UPI0031F6EAB8